MPVSPLSFVLSKLDRRWGRWIGLAFGLCSLALLSGCVYLRLLDLRHQLFDFDRYFTLDSNQGVEITCLEPILLKEDMAFFGLAPEKATTRGTMETWDLRWVKLLPPGATEPTGRDMTARLTFQAARLQKVALDEAFFALIPKTVFVGTLKALGHASIEMTSKSAQTNFASSTKDAQVLFPKIASIREGLGLPYAEKSENGLTWLEYRYATVPRHPPKDVIRLVLQFDQGTGHLKSADCAFSIGKFHLNME